MTPEQHVLRWQELHGVEASGLVRRWLRLVLWVSRPLRVPPWTVTLAGLVVTAAALVAPLPVAAALVLLAGLLDGVDGCVAVLLDRVTDLGRRLDHTADRLGEAAFGALLWRAGAPVWLAVLAVLLMWAVELLRRGPVVTVAERPVRVLLTASALLVVPDVWAWALVALSAAGVGQLLRSRIVT
ncbi:MAG: CDP-alcohol phosphatidyltransferase [Frankiales bacterium]|nr:CDP-alcohol phosphatidyltransferase [Frankiales bacterium]